MFDYTPHTTNKAILLSTHDMDLALRNADCLWVLPKEGELQMGAPEDLVLNGVLEQAFASKGIVFNRNNGAFQPQQEYDHSVQLIGEGEAIIWTKRALERMGISIVKSSALKIEVKTVADGNKWILYQHNETETIFTIYDLMLNIRQTFYTNSK